jgi:hypothetical protein
MADNNNDTIANDEQLNQKKNLIQKEIIEKNFKKEQFIDFISVKKENGGDLSTWTFEELQDIIKEFVEFHGNDEDFDEQSDKENNNTNNNTKKQTNEDNINENKIKEIQNELEQSGDGNPISEIYHVRGIKEIKCKILEKSELNDKNVIIEIRNPRVVQSKNLLKTSYVVYEIYTDVTGWYVDRRYSDFVWLRTALRKLFPNILCPPLPGKKLNYYRRFEMDFIEKRIVLFKKFMNSILANETFKASEPLIAFLSMGNFNNFESKKKELLNRVASNYVEDIKTLNGYLKLLEDQGNEEYYNNVMNYFTLQNNVFERINGNLKNYYKNMQNAYENLEEIQRDFESLKRLNKKITMKEEITLSYEELGVFFKNWKRIIYNQNQNLKHYIKDFFKYIGREDGCFEELIKNREDIKKNYDNFNLKVIEKKEKLWASGDVTKYEVDPNENIDEFKLKNDKTYAMEKMCSKENNILNNINNQLMYANWMNKEELKRLIEMNAKKYIENIHNFSEAFYLNIGDCVNLYSEINSFYTKEDEEGIEAQK